MFTAKQKFNRTSEQVLGEVSALAHGEGKPVQALIDEALNDLIEKRKNTKVRAHVMKAYSASHQQYAALYQKLAK
jgi:hypothetical protein